MYKPVPQVLPHDEDSDNEVDTSIYFDQRFQDDSDDRPGDCEEESTKQLVDSEPFLSPGRKAALAFSILNCVGFVLLFLWALPCDCYICKAPPKLVDVQWEHHSNERGIVNFDVAVAKSKFNDVVVTIDKALPHPNLTTFTSNTNNLIGFNLRDGEKKWEKNLTSQVQNLNCHLIDVNKDGIHDCLVFISTQGLSMLDSRTGEMLWKCHSHQNPEKSSSPTSDTDLVDIDLVSDLNGDATSDLLAIVTNLTNSILIAVSGKSGELLWQHALHLNCTQVNNLSAIDFVVHHPLCIIYSDNSPDFKGTLRNIRFESGRRIPSTFNPINSGECPDCTGRLTFPDPVGNVSRCNVTFARTQIAPPIAYLVTGEHHWKIAFKSRHLIDNRNATENQLQVIEIDEPCDGTFKILARIPVAAGADVHYILHQGSRGLRDSLVTAESSVLRKIHLQAHR